MFTVELVRGVSPKAAESYSSNSVTFGRSKNANYQFSNAETTVSRGIHFKIKKKKNEAGETEYSLLNEKDNEIYVQRENGQTKIVNKDESQVLAKNSTIQIGKDGPILQFHLESDAGATVVKRHVKHSYGSIPETDVAASKTNRKLVVPVIAAVAVMAIIWNVMQEGESSDQSIRIAQQETKIEEIQGFQSNLVRLEAAIDATQKEVVNASALVKKLERQSDPSLTTSKYARSVYVLGVKDSLGKFQMVGTGWKVSDRKIITNAHVAEAMQEWCDVLAANNISMTRVAILPGVEGTTSSRKEIVLEATPRIHRGYAQYGDFRFPVLSLVKGLLNSTKDLEFLNCCDCAEFLSVDELPGIAIPVAPMEQLRKIKSGDRVITMGYPGLVADNENPSIIHDSGIITSLTDTFNRTASPDRTVKLGISMNISGGASGSPIFNQDGVAIGIVTSSRSRETDKFSFGDRADFIHDLLKSDYSNAFLEYEKYLWEFRNESIDIESTVNHIMEKILASHIEQTASWTTQTTRVFKPGKGLVVSKEVTISKSDDRLVEVLTDLDVNGWCGIVAVAAEGFDLDMEVQFEYPVTYNNDGTVRGPQQARLVWPAPHLPTELMTSSTPFILAWIPPRNSIFLVNPWKNYSTNWYHDGQEKSKEMKVRIAVAEFRAVVEKTVGPVWE